MKYFAKVLQSCTFLQKLRPIKTRAFQGERSRRGLFQKDIISDPVKLLSLPPYDCECQE